jgi:hypothetical protein
VRRLARHLLTLCSVVSLAVFVAAGSFWLRSHWRSEVVTTNAGASLVGVATYRGHFIFVRGRREPTEGFEFRSESVESLDDDWQVIRDGAAWRAAGLSYTNFGSGVLHAVVVPAWLIALLSILPPAGLLYPAHRRRRRKRAGLCAACGYDLRATPGRCPECGASPKVAT